MSKKFSYLFAKFLYGLKDGSLRILEVYNIRDVYVSVLIILFYLAFILLDQKDAYVSPCFGPVQYLAVCFSSGRSFSTSAFKQSEPHTPAPSPVKAYSNVDTQKKQIVRENKGLAGVYCFINTVNGKLYVGSSVDLGKRMTSYYSYMYLSSSESMPICKALLLYGYSKFRLEILEYCDLKDCLTREKHYFEVLKPEYNLSKEPASPMLGRNHTVEAKAKQREARSKRVGENSPFYGETHGEETKKKMSVARKGIYIGENHPS